ncbi:MAG: LCP family protein [Candidatus Magasanikbacteria bacterium]|nr:LCP family protein [Candidatus Magasanikbacteria bacterium]
MYRRPINLLHGTMVDEPEETPSRKKKALLVIAFFVLSLSAISIIARHYALAEWPADASEYDNVTLRPKSTGILETVKNFIFHSDYVLQGEADDRVNILILGIGGPGHDGPYLSDTNIILSFQPSTKEVALISIPRDLGVEIPNHGWRKINSADAFGESEQAGWGGDYARAVFAKTFNLSIPYYIRVDFTAFRDLIDGLGGLTINVPTAFTDEAFPGPNDSYQTIRFDAGVQTMTGEQALNYSRSRHGNNNEGSDFARAHRQQLVLSALKEKLLSLGTYANPMTLQKIFNSLASHITTNLNFGQIMYAASLAKEVSAAPKTLVLDNSTTGYLISTTGESGAFLLSPKTGDFATINAGIKDIFEPAKTAAITNSTTAARTASPEGATQIHPGTIEIQNGTWRVGLAARVNKELGGKGFDVIAVGNSLKRPIATTTIYILQPKAPKDTINKLAATLHASVSTTLSDWLQATYDNPGTTEDERGMKYNHDTDILLILGNDTPQ